MTIKWRVQGDDKADAIAREATTIECKDASLTQQSFTEDADLNTIARRFGLTGKPIPPSDWNPSYYGDFTNVPDLRTALEQVRTAQHNFEQLPAELRARFYNDPAKLYDFVHDPANAEEAVRLKILAPAPTTTSAGAAATAPPPSPSSQTHSSTGSAGIGGGTTQAQGAPQSPPQTPQTTPPTG